MVNRIKKYMVLISVVTIIGMLLSACSEDKADKKDSSTGSGAAMEDYKVGDTFKAKEALTLSILYSDQPSYPLKEDWLLFEEIKKRTNIELDLTVVPMSDYGEKRSLLISAGDAPLIIPKTYPGEEAPFVASGVVLPISDYVDQMPHFKDKVEKWELDYYIDGLRHDDGKYYVLPGLHEEVWPDYTLAIRTDILEELKLETPTTWKELEVVLAKMKEAYPEVTPFSDRFTMDSTLNIAATGFDTVAGWGLGSALKLDADKDEFFFAPVTDEYKDLVSYFHGLIDKGLLDKESVTQDDEQAVQKFINGESFVINTNSQTIVDYRTDMDETLGEGNYSVEKIIVPGGPAGELMGGSKLENGVMILAAAEDDPEFDAIIQFVDWLYYSDEGQEFTKWGVEDVTYTKDGDGKRVLTDDVDYNGLNPSGTKNLRIDYGFSGGVFAYGGTTDLLHSMMLEEEVAFQEAMHKTKTTVLPDPAIKYSELDLERANLLSTPLKDSVSQNTLKFILGTRDLSEWNDYVKEMENQRMQDYVDLANETYEASK